MDAHFSILIIEDDPAMARSLKEALSSERFIPDWAETGSEGLQRVLTHNPHLIFWTWLLRRWGIHWWG
jgi:DNA-binding response OmpR family regulator